MFFMEPCRAGSNHKNERLKRPTAKDIMEYVLKHKELEGLEKRVVAIEARFNEHR
jgi:hypothetical protein